jgi:hypothetical protein
VLLVVVEVLVVVVVAEVLCEAVEVLVAEVDVETVVDELCDAVEVELVEVVVEADALWVVVDVMVVVVVVTVVLVAVDVEVVVVVTTVVTVVAPVELESCLAVEEVESPSLGVTESEADEATVRTTVTVEVTVTVTVEGGDLANPVELTDAVPRLAPTGSSGWADNECTTARLEPITKNRGTPIRIAVTNLSGRLPKTLETCPLTFSPALLIFPRRRAR